MMSNLKTTGRKELPIVVKGDVQGSVEAITAALEKLGNEEVAARVIHGGVGGVTESDVTLADASKAVIIGFNVRAHKEARDLAEQQGIEIRYYNIIYNLVDDVKAAMSGMLAPTLRETMLGNALILEVFTISKVGNVAGCRVTDGVVQRGAHVRLIRDNVVVHEGKLSTLKRFKDEVADRAGRPGMRHGVRELSGHAQGRRHRVLQRRGNPPHAVSGGGGGSSERCERASPAPPKDFDRRAFTVGRESCACRRRDHLGRREFRADRGRDRSDAGEDARPRAAEVGAHLGIARALPEHLWLGVERRSISRADTFVEPDLVVYPRGLKLEAVKGSDIVLAIEVALTSLAYDRGLKSRSTRATAVFRNGEFRPAQRRTRTDLPTFAASAAPRVELAARRAFLLSRAAPRSTPPARFPLINLASMSRSDSQIPQPLAPPRARRRIVPPRPCPRSFRAARSSIPCSIGSSSPFPACACRRTSSWRPSRSCRSAARTRRRRSLRSTRTRKSCARWSRIASISNTRPTCASCSTTVSTRRPASTRCCVRPRSRATWGRRSRGRQLNEEAENENVAAEGRPARPRARTQARAAPLDARRGQRLDQSRQACRRDLDAGGRRSSNSCSTPRRRATPARSIRSPPACCRSRSARRPRPCPSCRTARRPIASRSNGARRPTPTTPRAG